MTVSKAIDILNGQKAKVSDPNHYNDDNWVFQTTSYIKDFFGESSPEYSWIGRFTFTVPGHTEMTNEMGRRELDQKDVKVIQFLNNCIETLKHKGLHKKPKQNFSYRLSDTALWTLIPLIGTGLISTGFFFGNLYSDKQNIELRQDNKLMKDSLIILRTSSGGNSLTSSKHDTIIQKSKNDDNQK